MTKMKKYELIFRIGSERPSDFPKATERRSMHLKPPSVLSNHPRSGRRSQGPHITKAAYSPGDTPPTTARCCAVPPPPLTPHRRPALRRAAGDRCPLRGCAVEAGGGPGGRPGTGCVATLQKKQPCAASSGAALACPSPRCSMRPLPRTLELFYDVLSPYSWLGFEVTPGLRGQGRRAEQTQDAGPRVSCNSGHCPQGV